ncbi:class A beta-lactamase [Actinophytocola sp.]|uniref:class A beta-lactamase n=1 Tax=Actinophytocola sp. TaxID=1872138 RepID=UPI002ED599BC
MGKTLLAAVLGVALVAGCSAAPTSAAPPSTTTTTTTVSATPADPGPLRDLEKQHGIRLGVYALNVDTGQTLSYRDGEPFAMMSVFKAYLVAALLHEHPLSTGFFDKRITYTEADLVMNSPVTSARVATGMTVAELSEATITVSDNTAANLLLKELGGPASLTAFARNIGDTKTRLDRYEPEMSAAVPGDVRDTTTPTAIGEAFKSLVLGDVLPAPEKEQLTAWLLANRTGGERIRAGVPKDWKTADKTGSGYYGSANDVAITWTPDGTPLVIAIMTTKEVEGADYDSAPIAAAAEVAAESLT